MNATFSPVGRRCPGASASLSQSGGVGIELLVPAHALGLGISTFVSMGNKADVSSNDLLQYWADDPRPTSSCCTSSRSATRGKFAHAGARTRAPQADRRARRAAGPPPAPGALGRTPRRSRSRRRRRRPLPPDRVSSVSTRSRSSSTSLRSLVTQPVPAGRRVAVMSNGGGPAIVAADACVAAGLEVPELSPTMQAALHELAPTGGVQNPVDLIASAGATVFERAAELLLDRARSMPCW